MPKISCNLSSFGGLCNEFNKYYKFRGVQRQQNAQGNRNERLTDFFILWILFHLMVLLFNSIHSVNFYCVQ